jgi:hypothetical protein
MAKTDALAITSPGSRALKNAKYEKYCRLRASAQHSKKDDVAYANACRLERRPGVRERIEYLSHQEEELIAEKRRRIEETLWSIHEADIGEFFETYEIAKTDKNGNIETDANGNMLTIEKERPRKLSNIPAEIRRNIEKVTIDGKGRAIPQLYSKLAASQQLRKMLNIGGQKDRPETDVSRLSDAELIQQLADQAKELGIEINLNYSFAQQSDE